MQDDSRCLCLCLCLHAQLVGAADYRDGGKGNASRGISAVSGAEAGSDVEGEVNVVVHDDICVYIIRLFIVILQRVFSLSSR